MKRRTKLTFYLIALNSLVYAQPNAKDSSYYQSNGLLGNFMLTSDKQSDGKIVFGGSFNNVNGVSSKNILRMNQDGTLDTSFHVGSAFPFNTFKIVVQPDQKIVIGHAGIIYNGQTTGRIVRLLPNGNVDPSFNHGTFVNNEVYAIKVLNDGKLLIGGYFTAYNGIPNERIMRLLPNGALDTSFQVINGPDDSVLAIDTQSDGKVIVGGKFYSFPTYNGHYLARLHPNGDLDSTFQIGIGANNDVKDIHVLPNDKILVSGYFSSFNGINCNGIIRLNADGSIDSTFQTTILNSGVWDIEVDAQNRIYLGSSSENNNPSLPKVNHIVRLLENGSEDPTFNYLLGGNGNVYTLCLQDDNKLVAGGSFTTYNGDTANKIVRIHTECPTTPSFYSLNATVTSLYLNETIPNHTFIEWYDCTDNVLLLDSSMQFTPSSTGDFYAIVNNFGCKDSTACFHFEFNQINETHTTNLVFPNPFCETLTIKTEGQHTIELLDVNGTVHLTEKIDSGSISLQTENLNAGMYFVKLTSDQGIVSISKCLKIN